MWLIKLPLIGESQRAIPIELTDLFIPATGKNLISYDWGKDSDLCLLSWKQKIKQDNPSIICLSA